MKKFVKEMFTVRYSGPLDFIKFFMMLWVPIGLISITVMGLALVHPLLLLLVPIFIWVLVSILEKNKYEDR